MPDEREMRPKRAFPSVAISDDHGGMLLRDWFAGQALAGFLTHAGPAFRETWVDTADWCYEMADAMMAEREKS